jgi:hypothetical protein
MDKAQKPSDSKSNPYTTSHQTWWFKNINLNSLMEMYVSSNNITITKYISGTFHLCLQGCIYSLYELKALLQLVDGQRDTEV